MALVEPAQLVVVVALAAKVAMVKQAALVALVVRAATDLYSSFRCPSQEVAEMEGKAEMGEQVVTEGKAEMGKWRKWGYWWYWNYL